MSRLGNARFYLLAQIMIFEQKCSPPSTRHFLFDKHTLINPLPMLSIESDIF